MRALILIPVTLACLRIRTRRYLYSPLTTLACACLALSGAPVAAAGLTVSAAGDWYMAHRNGRSEMYRLGIVGFFCGHVLFLIHSLGRVRSPAAGLIACAALGIWMCFYLKKRILKGVPEMLRLPVVCYGAISAAGFSAALATMDALYALSIGLLVLSDTLIAERDFAGSERTAKWILPTYYACHILMALSAMPA
ncbi:MAG: hypothetical protein IJH78_05780 [Clostridia bacterium]|nr:hypothetical protein [Clostridia bacterium]